ncbi:hypothetical protein CPB84DRAFT_1794454 [Gymnopilus junonius]|uniref:Uncharacterized protein n=1 Tax=Gymnopilus junonius TaxID=109634 RepID=A0A9P5TGH1_GYMJU|nr:hypothetical protein CPB84DRAFT_1794454 [Gymnopilus junonius]
MSYRRLHDNFSTTIARGTRRLPVIVAVGSAFPWSVTLEQFWRYRFRRHFLLCL